MKRNQTRVGLKRPWCINGERESHRRKVCRSGWLSGGASSVPHRWNDTRISHGCSTFGWPDSGQSSSKCPASSGIQRLSAGIYGLPTARDMRTRCRTSIVPRCVTSCCASMGHSPRPHSGPHDEPAGLRDGSGREDMTTARMWCPPLHQVAPRFSAWPRSEDTTSARLSCPPHSHRRAHLDRKSSHSPLDRTRSSRVGQNRQASDRISNA